MIKTFLAKIYTVMAVSDHNVTGENCFSYLVDFAISLSTINVPEVSFRSPMEGAGRVRR